MLKKKNKYLCVKVEKENIHCNHTKPNRSPLLSLVFCFYFFHNTTSAATLDAQFLSSATLFLSISGSWQSQGTFLLLLIYLPFHHLSPLSLLSHSVFSSSLFPQTKPFPQSFFLDSSGITVTIFTQGML